MQVNSLLIYVFFISISTTFCGSHLNCFKLYSKNMKHCKFKYKYSEPRKPFKLVSFEHGTLLMVSSDGSLVAVESSPNLLQQKNVWFVRCQDQNNAHKYHNVTSRKQSFEICTQPEPHVEQKLVYNKIYKHFHMISTTHVEAAGEEYMYKTVMTSPFNKQEQRTISNNGFLVSIQPTSGGNSVKNDNRHVLQVKTARSILKKSSTKEFIKVGRLKMVKRRHHRRKHNLIQSVANDVILELQFKE